MIEAVLILVIAVLCVMLAYERYMMNCEREKLINALISKNAQELGELERVAKTNPEPQVEKEPEYTPAESISDKKFDELVKETNEGETE
jgi:hypothetical protein